MLGQNPVIYGGSLEENLQIGLRFSEKLPASRDRLLNALEQVKLDKPLDDPCLSLSGGEKQRLCLARVMLMDAEVYLLDEPSAALDKETEHFIITNLADFVIREKKELIMVTHSEEVSGLYPEGTIRIENGPVSYTHLLPGLSLHSGISIFPHKPDAPCRKNRSSLKAPAHGLYWWG